MKAKMATMEQRFIYDTFVNKLRNVRDLAGE